MNKFRLLAAFTLSLAFASCTGNAQESNQKTTDSMNKIEVIDFYSTHRCMTCNAIEASTKYTLDTYFAEELKSGKITFQTVNVDKDENYTTAEKFEATGTALFLNVIIDGKETQINLTDFAFMKGNEQEEFANELKQKIEAELKKL